MMAFPSDLLTPSTWRVLGLGLATTIFSLGAGSLITPVQLAGGLGVTPTTSSDRDVVEKMMVFVGARDLCLGAALLWFHYEEKQREMGMLMTTGVVIYVLDIWIAAKGPRGWDRGVWGLTAAAAVGTVVGLGLLQL